MKVPPAEILHAFAALPSNPTKAQVAQFVEQYFAPAGILTTHLFASLLDLEVVVRAFTA